MCCFYFTQCCTFNKVQVWRKQIKKQIFALISERSLAAVRSLSSGRGLVAVTTAPSQSWDRSDRSSRRGTPWPRVALSRQPEHHWHAARFCRRVSMPLLWKQRDPSEGVRGAVEHNKQSTLRLCVVVSWGWEKRGANMEGTGEFLCEPWRCYRPKWFARHTKKVPHRTTCPRYFLKKKGSLFCTLGKLRQTLNSQ